jgi:hypothetical protein
MSGPLCRTAPAHQPASLALKTRTKGPIRNEGLRAIGTFMSSPSPAAHGRRLLFAGRAAVGGLALACTLAFGLTTVRLLRSPL